MPSVLGRSSVEAGVAANNKQPGQSWDRGLLGCAVSLTSGHDRPDNSGPRHDAGLRLLLDPRQAQAMPAWSPPLSTRGRYIVDRDGNRFRLRSGNWHGASGTYLGGGDYSDPANHHAGEVAYQTPLCLDRVKIDQIVADFVRLGINSVRLPFSNHMIRDNTTVPDSALGANAQLRGKTPLQVYDEVVAALTRAGLAVILNNHTTRNLWCCGLDSNARWNTAQTDQQWQEDWIFMAKRYRDNARVVGAELYNEVRRDLLFDPTWGDGSNADWHAASLAAGSRILREANPDLLIIVGGINWVGIPTPFTSHGRPELSPASLLSHTLPVPDKLVYAAHFYAYTGQNNTGGVNGPGSNDPLYRDLDPTALYRTVDQLAGFVATPENAQTKHYTAPVWISEYGSAGRSDALPKDRYWWETFTRYLIDKDLEYAVWPLVGWHENGQGDGWALNMYDARGQRIGIDEPAGDWRLPAWERLRAYAGRQGEISPRPVFRMLSTDHGGMQQSSTLAADVRWQPGKVKASCPDGMRMHGMSHQPQPRLICTDATFGRRLLDEARGLDAFEYVPDGRHVTVDWAKGYTKLQCPLGSFASGYSFTDDSDQALICALASKDLRTSGNVGNRTVWFDRRSALAADYGTFARDGASAGSCAENELLIGIASRQVGVPAALLCQNFNQSAAVGFLPNAATGNRFGDGNSLLGLVFATLLGFLLRQRD